MVSGRSVARSLFKYCLARILIADINMKVPVLPLRNLTTSPAFYMFVAFAAGVLLGDSFYGQLKSYVDWAVVLVGLLVVLAVAVLYSSVVIAAGQLRRCCLLRFGNSGAGG